MIVFNTPVSGALKIKPPKHVKIMKDYLITQPDRNLKIEYVHQGVNAGRDFIHLPRTNFQHPYVIVLKIQKYKAK